ncbi:MAG: hypothetical protein E6J41_33630 [Chloroflexi bacterium]|nr:MAG: hypothetical protein E6J41_33630 [Chloroflexota bacterium]
MAEERRPHLPPWNWTQLTGAMRRAEFEALAEWVADLQQAYGRWVRLPPCWPCHRALRTELTAFWYWRQHIDTGANATPEESVRWHQSLRMSAQAWAEAFGGCRHESVGEVDEERDVREAMLEAATPYLDRVTGQPSRASEA